MNLWDAVARPAYRVEFGMNRAESVAYDPYEARRKIGYRVMQLIHWIFVLIEGLIAIWFVLKALGANPAAAFARFIYGITDGPVGPFLVSTQNPSSPGSDCNPALKRHAVSTR